VKREIEPEGTVTVAGEIASAPGGTGVGFALGSAGELEPPHPVRSAKAMSEMARARRGTQQIFLAIHRTDFSKRFME
jgi:hypothetical protein